ncbi:MAG: hypothetical protein KGI33_04805 [Thaumarchaeota archaeon]|nr:hypothetical protein [Nitrososphaerota archaeon]
MIRYKVSRGMGVLFVGINPHPGSYRRGIPFSNNKMFWYILSRAGAIDEDAEELKDDKRLKRVYETRFSQVYGYGFLNVINRPTVDISMLERGEERNGRRKILGAIRDYRPQVVCFIGKVAYEKFTGTRNFGFGWQDDIFGSRSYVMHFPLRGRASVRVREIRTVLRFGKNT